MENSTGTPSCWVWRQEVTLVKGVLSWKCLLAMLAAPPSAGQPARLTIRSSRFELERPPATHLLCIRCSSSGGSKLLCQSSLVRLQGGAAWERWGACSQHTRHICTSASISTLQPCPSQCLTLPSPCPSAGYATLTRPTPTPLFNSKSASWSAAHVKTCKHTNSNAPPALASTSTHGTMHVL